MLPLPPGGAVGLGAGLEAASPPATEEVEELAMSGEGAGPIMTEEEEGSGSGWASASVLLNKWYII